MASDQRRKRLNGESMVSYCSPEQYRTKKRKNSGIVQSDLTMKSHVSVEWDGKHQRVVAKREQIGISWRQMRPFANFDHNGHKVLADVLAIPPEVFELGSLSEVLSYEVIIMFCDHFQLFAAENVYLLSSISKLSFVKLLAGLEHNAFGQREKSSYAVSS